MAQELSQELYDYDRFVKILGIIGFVSLIISDVLAYINPQKGYELSFYTSTPSIIFVLIGICIVSGIIILFHQVYYENYKSSRIWFIGLFLLLMTRIIILCLPYIRNYYTWVGDNSTHFGIIKEIIIKGTINQGNFYPIVHIFLSQFQILTSLPIELIVNHSTAFLSVMFVSSTYLLAKSVFNDNKPVILTLAAVGCVLFSSYDLYLMPNGWSCLYLPLVIFFLLKYINPQNNSPFKILAAITMVLYPLFHPLSTFLLMFLLILFIFMPYFVRFSNNFLKRSKFISIFHNINIPLFLLFILVDVWTMWIIKFGFFNNNIKYLINAIITRESFDVLGSLIEQFNKMNLTWIDFLILLIKQNGDELIFLLVFIIGVYILLKNIKTFKNAINIIYLAVTTLFFGLLYFIYLLRIFPGLEAIGAERLLAYVVLTIPVFAGITYTYAISQKKKGISLVCILLLIVPPILTLFAIIPSPYILRPTPDMTEMDLKSMGWSIEYKDPKLPYRYIMSPPFRYADVIIGITERSNRRDIEGADRIPNHFNYSEYRFFGQMYTEDSYAVITKFDTILYDTVYKPVGRFSSSDFERLQMDSTVNRIYNNNECTVYYILGQS